MIPWGWQCNFMGFTVRTIMVFPEAFLAAGFLAGGFPATAGAAAGAAGAAGAEGAAGGLVSVMVVLRWYL